jgi:hypothetical protein
MDVDKIRTVLSEQFRHFPSRLRRPDDLGSESQPAEQGLGVNFPIAAAIDNHLVSLVFEHLPFLLEYDVLASGLLVRVVYNQDFHVWLSYLAGVGAGEQACRIPPLHLRGPLVWKRIEAPGWQ